MLKQWKQIQEIFVACPGGCATGGTELLHQLVHTLRIHGRNAFIFYYEKPEIGRPAVFDCYDAPQKVPANDDSQLVIVPEMGVHLLRKFKSAQKCIWWLSVDNYFVAYGREEQLSLWRRFKRFRRGRSPYPWASDPMVTHLVQSQYAADYLKPFDISPLFLGDYLRDTFLESKETDASSKSNKVCYNPKKGSAFTQQLLSREVGWEWAELSNLSPDGMRDLLLSSKAYIDFGHHPGKDRIPREAAICGCVVITGRDGSASNASDIAIDPCFKIDQHEPDAVETTLQAIRSALDDYERAFAQQKPYRMKIRQEKNEFIQAVRTLFGTTI